MISCRMHDILPRDREERSAQIHGSSQQCREAAVREIQARALARPCMRNSADDYSDNSTNPAELFTRTPFLTRAIRNIARCCTEGVHTRWYFGDAFTGSPRWKDHSHMHGRCDGRVRWLRSPPRNAVVHMLWIVVRHNAQCRSSRNTPALQKHVAS